MDPESLMFRDGRRKIDMVICYEEENEGVMTELEARRRESRRVFQENLVKDGLEVEVEDKTQSFDERTCFIKIHLPWRSEVRYAEVLNLKLPVKRFITISVKAWVKYCLIIEPFRLCTSPNTHNHTHTEIHARNTRTTIYYVRLSVSMQNKLCCGRTLDL